MTPLRPPCNATPIVALTAHVLGDERARCLAFGLDDHLRKPLTPAALERMITK